MLAWILMGAGGLWLLYIVVWPKVLNYFTKATVAAVSTTETVATNSDNLAAGSAACVTLANIAWQNKDAALAAKVAEVWTLMSKIPGTSTI
jgi:hypothetical protein